MSDREILNSVNVIRDILARLLYLFNSTGRKINSEKALNYPLFAVPLSLYNAVGSLHKTSKSKLAQILMSKSFDENTDASKVNTVYAVDLDDTEGDFRIFGRICT